MVVLIKKKRNSVKDKRFIKIQGKKNTKRFLRLKREIQSKKNPRQKIYFQRGGRGFPEGTQLIIMAGIVVVIMGGIFFQTNIRQLIRDMVDIIDIPGMAKEVQIAIFEYVNNLFTNSPSMTAAKTLPQWLLWGIQSFSGISLATANFGVTIYGIYSWLTLKLSFVRSIMRSIVGKSAKPLFDQMQNQFTSFIGLYDTILDFLKLSMRGARFVNEAINGIVAKIITNFIQPLFGDALGLTGKIFVTVLTTVEELLNNILRNAGVLNNLCDTIIASEQVKSVNTQIIYCKNVARQSASGAGVRLKRFAMLPLDLFISALQKIREYEYDEKAYYTKEDEALLIKLIQEEADAAKEAVAEAARAEAAAAEQLKALVVIKLSEARQLARAEAAKEADKLAADKLAALTTFSATYTRPPLTKIDSVEGITNQLLRDLGIPDMMMTPEEAYHEANSAVNSVKADIAKELNDATKSLAGIFNEANTDARGIVTTHEEEQIINSVRTEAPIDISAMPALPAIQEVEDTQEFVEESAAAALSPQAAVQYVNNAIRKFKIEIEITPAQKAILDGLMDKIKTESAKSSIIEEQEFYERLYSTMHELTIDTAKEYIRSYQPRREELVTRRSAPPSSFYFRKEQGKDYKSRSQSVEPTVGSVVPTVAALKAKASKASKAALKAALKRESSVGSSVGIMETSGGHKRKRSNPRSHKRLPRHKRRATRKITRRR